LSNQRIYWSPGTKLSGHHRSGRRANNFFDNRAITRYVITQDVVTMSDPTILILSSLAEGDKHGYAIMEDIQTFAGIRLGPGTLYGAISRLEDRGWIRAVRSQSRRQPYRITAEGSLELKRQLALFGQVVRTGNRRLKEA
jgi:DNA-binding PadR family transcriptional regulator